MFAAVVIGLAIVLFIVIVVVWLTWRRFFDDLFRNASHAWMKIVGAGVILGFLGLASAYVNLDERDEASRWGIAFVVGGITFLIGAVLGSALVFRDGVKLSIRRGESVNPILRLLLASGVVSIAIWVVGAFAGAILFTFLMIQLETGGIRSRAPLAANNSSSSGAATKLNANADSAPPPPPPPPGERPRQPISPSPTETTPPEIAPEASAVPSAVVNNSGEASRNDLPPAKPKMVLPLDLPKETPLKEAYQQFVDRYGAERVARVVVRLETPDPFVQQKVYFELKRRTDPDHPDSIFVSTQGTTVAGIAAPVGSFDDFAADFPLGKVTKLQPQQRMVFVALAGDRFGVGRVGAPERPAAAPSAAPDKPDAGGDLTSLLAKVKQGGLREKTEALDAIAAVNTPQAAEALAAMLTTDDRSWAASALEKMGAIAQKPVLKHAASADFFTSVEAFRVLEKIGTKAILLDLAKLARHRDIGTASRAKRAISAINGK